MCHLLHITAIERQFVGNLLGRQVESHEIQAQYPDFQWLMMAGKDGVGQIIKAFVTVATFISLTCRFRVITPPLDDLCGLTRGAGDAVWPA
jgi:hypothetical protein